MKYNIIIVIFLQILITFYAKSTTKIKSDSKQFVSPQLVSSDGFYNNLYSSNVFTSSSSANMVTPIINHSLGSSHAVVSTVTPAACGCAAQVQRCQPCSSVYVLPRIIPSCPCAPKPQCPQCPPLSLIHNIAAQKASRDAKIASDVTNLTFQLNMHLKKINQYSNEIAKIEADARDAAVKMEESFTKSQIARQKMIQSSNQAKMVAHAALTGAQISFGGDLGLNNIVNPNMSIFPEEIPSVSQYVKEKTNGSNLRTSKDREFTKEPNHNQVQAAIIHRTPEIVIKTHHANSSDSEELNSDVNLEKALDNLS